MEGGCAGSSSGPRQHLPSLPRKMGNGPGPPHLFIHSVPSPSSPFFAFVAFYISCPATPSIYFFLIYACLGVSYSLPKFSAACSLLNCNFAFPFFPPVQVSVEASVRLCHPPSQGSGLGMAGGTAARAARDPGPRVTPQAMASALSMAS